jgi:acetyl esterase/lipase
MKDFSLLKWLASALAAWGLAGCTGLDLLNTISGDPAVDPVTLSYGVSVRQRVDIYPVPGKAGAIISSVAANPAAATLRPVVIFFYGGAWASGSKADYAFVAKTFNDMGYVVAIPDYRLTPETAYPGFVQDSAVAVHLVIARAAEFGGDPKNIVLMGHSAGAYNAAMVAMDPRWLSAADRARIKGFVGLASPVNFLPIQMPEAQRAFNWPNTPRDTQPIEHVSRDNPPMLLITAKRDPLVDPEVNSKAMAEKLQALGVSVRVETVDGPLGLVNHANLVGTLSGRFSFLGATLKRTQEFVEQVTR